MRVGTVVGARSHTPVCTLPHLSICDSDCEGVVDGAEGHSSQNEAHPNGSETESRPSPQDLDILRRRDGVDGIEGGDGVDGGGDNPELLGGQPGVEDCPAVLELRGKSEVTMHVLWNTW